MFNCVPTIKAICMLVMIHLRSAFQQCLVVALTLSTIKIHMVPYKHTRKTFLQFTTLAGESPKWNTLVVTWALVICMKYTYLHSDCAFVLVCIFQANHSCPCYSYLITINQRIHLWYCNSNPYQLHNHKVENISKQTLVSK